MDSGADGLRLVVIVDEAGFLTDSFDAKFLLKHNLLTGGQYPDCLNPIMTLPIILELC